MSIQLPSTVYAQGTGTRNQNVEVPIIAQGPPGINSVNFPIGKRWIDVLNVSEYSLCSLTAFNGVQTANWQLLGPINPALAAPGTSITQSGFTAALSSGGVETVALSSLTTSVVIFSPQFTSATTGAWGVVPANGSFTIHSTQAGDTSTFFYAVIN